MVEHMVDCLLVERVPTVEEYMSFRKIIGWDNISEEGSRLGPDHSLHAVCAECDGRLIGFGRVVGDGVKHFYIVDMIVLPEFHKLGIGSRIMENLMGYISDHAEKGSFVGLMAAKGASRFYEKFGFKVRSQEMPGMCMVWGNK